MIIRRLTPEDIPAVCAIEQSCFSQPWTESGLLSQLEAHGNISLCAEEGGIVTGYLLACAVLDEISLWRIASSPEHRCCGTGGALLAALDTANERAATVYLEVRAGNVAAVSLYEKHGYVHIGRRPNFYDKPVEDALLMKYTIPRKEKDDEDTGN